MLIPRRETLAEFTYGLKLRWNKFMMVLYPSRATSSRIGLFQKDMDERIAILQRIHGLKHSVEVYQDNLFPDDTCSLPQTAKQMDMDGHSATPQRVHDANKNAEAYGFDLLPELDCTPPQSQPPEKMDTLPDYTADEYTEAHRQQDIWEARDEYQQIRRRLVKTWSEMPKNAVSRYFGLRENHRDINGLTDLWYEGRADCSQGGGCCGRNCGCCEKPLDQYYLPNGYGATRDRELIRIVGHCTAECTCCVMTHGVYNPDERLPDPRFVC